VLALFTQTATAGISFNFVSEPGAWMKFDGTANTFDFSPDPVSFADFSITGSSPTGLATFKGTIAGPFNVGTVSTFGPLQTASVLLPLGTFVVLDGATPLTATLDWVDISTYGTAGALNALGTANLTGITYTGSNSVLNAIKNGTGQTLSLSFSFTPAKTLTQLMADGTLSRTSYSGTFYAVPEPSSVALLGMGALGALAFVWRRRRS